MPDPATLADENPIIRAYRLWQSSCPFASRSTMLAVVASFLAVLIFPRLGLAFNNTIDRTVQHLEVYRLVTTVISGQGILSMVFGIMSFNQVGPRLERSLGSTGLLALMVTLTVCANLAFIAICYMLFCLGKQEALFMEGSGMWNLIISLVAVECMANPEQTRRFWIVPVDIPSKYYPLVLVFIFGLMKGSFHNLLCAAGVGYAYATGRMDGLKPSRSRLAAWESGCLSNFVNRPGYIINGAALGQNAFGIPLNNPADHPSNQRGDDQGNDGNSGFSLFRRGGAGNDREQGGGGRDDNGNGGFGANSVIKRGGGNGGGKSVTAKESFAGSGQTLGGGGAGGTRLQLSGRGQAPHDPETARLARLAALEGRGVAAGGGRGGDLGGVATPLLHPIDDDVRVLQDMGYSAEEASEALQRNGGDIEAAAAYLTA